MPKIEFSNLPPEIRRHLIERIHERTSRVDALEALKKWVNSQPDAPEGDWYKDFGSFWLCGSGRYPKTVLTRAMKPFGTEIE